MLKPEDFLKKAHKIHGNKYDYSKLKMRPFEEHEEILCKKCNKIFIQRRKDHLEGRGCQLCGYIKCKRPAITFEKFVSRGNLKYNNSFVYNPNGYQHLNSKIKIKHLNCGNEFTQTARKHLEDKISCPFCCGKTNKKKINQIDKDTGVVINTFDSLHDAARYLNADVRPISFGAINSTTSYGFLWEYV